MLLDLAQLWQPLRHSHLLVRFVAMRHVGRELEALIVDGWLDYLHPGGTGTRAILLLVGQVNVLD